ncbi:zeta toxin family protein [Spirosoma koreense]
MLLHEFSPKELERAKRRLTGQHLLSKPIFNQTPLGVLLGGQPASGKTRLFEYIQRANPKIDFTPINGDEYRQYHPRAQEIEEEYGQEAPKYTQAFSNTLVDYLKAECLRLRCNFIIEGTMRTYAVIERTASELKKAGFQCEAHVLAVAREDSLLGIFQRFEGDKQRTGVGRFSPIEVHDEAYRQIPINLTRADANRLIDRIVVYSRQSDGQLQVGLDHTYVPAKPIDFVLEFERLRQPVFDRQFYHQQWVVLNELARRRGETNLDYLSQITTFIEQFRQ